ncbi:Component of a membrane-bound complex containing the Tor2p kinase [Cladophialophora chaetospira]|uniref:Component of a membrane-bound complex containing the Tor2p kinase n=1 Tax=Cladophialophora chaetospira TaxID=386627 RepID=A0AA38X5T8_9EURO|nr:Component of a membrane-bound complex containing the Tor2p kinase [Cladophialophora chaetospira]
MALLQNEDFAIWYLRTSYLASAKDGIAERLINVNSSILNTPGFRAAGWIADPVQRTYSPPIPTSVNTDYFREGADLQQLNSHEGDEDEGGLVTGRTSNDTIGPALNMRRRRRKEQVEEDDSSDLSDESDDEADGGQRTAQQIRFAKMPSRNRSDSSPIRGTDPDTATTSPNKPSTDNRRRTGSLGAVEAVKARARRDTTTSSDMSSENELDPAYFRRRQLNQTSKSVPLPGEDPMGVIAESGQQAGEDSDAESVGSAMSSELGDTLDSASLLNTLDDPNLTSTPLGSLTGSGPRSIQPESPRRQRTLPMLHELPPPRPISMIQPRSLLSAALGAQRRGPSNPLQAFAGLSGKGTPNALWIKVYAPFSDDSEEPFEMPLARTSKEGNPVTVVEAIGHALWRYQEQELSPALTAEQLDVNKWTLRMVEDGEVDDDFPPLVRTRPVTDFTDNNNRAGRGRSRGRPFDEFGLVEASAAQHEANKRDTPQSNTSEQSESTPVPSFDGFASQPTMQRPGTPKAGAGAGAPRNNILLAGQPFTTALTNTALTPADLPAPAGPQATPRMGSTKTIKIRYLNHDMTAQSMTMETSTDSYIAEILDHICKRWNLEKAGFILKVAGTNTVAPLDRTVEALGVRSELDLVRRRFGAGVSLTGSPGSSSPNAPLLLDIQGPTKKNKRGQPIQASSLKQDLLSGASNFKKYYVTRKQLGGFAQGSQRVLVFDGDIIHVMPADTSSNAKFSSIAFNDILKCKVSSKHPKLVRIVVRRVNESKRYDFEARIAGEAQEIVDEVTREMKLARA